MPSRVPTLLCGRTADGGWKLDISTETHVDRWLLHGNGLTLQDDRDQQSWNLAATDHIYE